MRQLPLQEVKKAEVRRHCLGLQFPSNLCADYVQLAGKANPSMVTQLLEEAAEGVNSASESELADGTGIA